MVGIVSDSSSVKSISHTIKIAVTADLPLMSEAIGGWIEKQQDMEIVAEASNARQSIEIISRLHPDIVIVDMSMQADNGLDTLKQIMAAWPGINILISTLPGDDIQAQMMLQAGANGCFARNASGRELINAIRSIVAEDKAPIPQTPKDIIDEATDKINPLIQSKIDEINFKELNIFKLVAKGMSNKDIALYLGISLRCVKSHLSTLFLKLGVSSRTQAISAGLKSAGQLSGFRVAGSFRFW